MKEKLKVFILGADTAVSGRSVPIEQDDPVSAQLMFPRGLVELRLVQKDNDTPMSITMTPEDAFRIAESLLVWSHELMCDGTCELATDSEEQASSVH